MKKFDDSEEGVLEKPSPPFFPDVRTGGGATPLPHFYEARATDRDLSTLPSVIMNRTKTTHWHFLDVLGGATSENLFSFGLR